MQRRGPTGSKRLTVLRSAVALVLGKAVPRKPGIALFHPAVAYHFGDDRGRGDREGASVALGHGELRQGTGWEAKVVEQERIRSKSEPGDGALHGKAVRGRDPQTVDDVMGGPADGDGGAQLDDRGTQLLAALRGELLGIAHAIQARQEMGSVKGQYDRGGNNRPGPAPSSYLVNARDEPVSLLEE